MTLADTLQRNGLNNGQTAAIEAPYMGSRRAENRLPDIACVLRNGGQSALKSFDQVAAEYPDIETERVYVDAAALFLVSGVFSPESEH